MSSSCQMYLAQQHTKLRFPVLPEKVEVAYGSNNDKMRVCGVGEVTVLQDSEAASIKFSSFFRGIISVGVIINIFRILFLQSIRFWN